MFSYLSTASRRIAVTLGHVRAARMSTQAEVLLERIDSKGVVTLNRPKALNALNLSMIRSIYPQVKAWEEDPSITMILIKGAGEKAFCAGGDVRAVTESGKRGDSLCEEFFKEEYTLNNAIGTMPFPWVAFIDGITMGGGVGLSVHGQYRIATERTVFAMPETAIGLFPDVGGGYFLPRLGGNLGIFLALTGFRLKGRDVQKSGVATHFVEAAKLGDLEQELLALQPASPQQIATTIQTYHDNTKIDEDKEFCLLPRMDDIDRLFSGQTMEKIFEDLERDGSEWALQQLATMKKMSPTSMKLTLRLLREGATRDMQDNFQVEYRLTQHIMKEKDFYEGVRAVLVDRDNAPKWSPSVLEAVTREKLEWYFSPLAEDKELYL